jgi:hypothetical protein
MEGSGSSNEDARRKEAHQLAQWANDHAGGVVNPLELLLARVILSLESIDDKLREGAGPPSRIP